MKIVCVDDEKLVLDLVVRLCRQMPQISEVEGFTGSIKALEYLKNNTADIALLDIDMPDINGIKLAVRISTCSTLTKAVIALSIHFLRFRDQRLLFLRHGSAVGPRGAVPGGFQPGWIQDRV